MDERTREAVTSRLDTRCIRWPFVRPAHPQRCGKCDGCLSARWLAAGDDAHPHTHDRVPVHLCPGCNPAR